MKGTFGVEWSAVDKATSIVFLARATRRGDGIADKIIGTLTRALIAGTLPSAPTRALIEELIAMKSAISAGGQDPESIVDGLESVMKRVEMLAFGASRGDS